MLRRDYNSVQLVKYAAIHIHVFLRSCDTDLLHSQLTAPLQGLGQLVEAALVTLDCLLASDSEDSEWLR